MTLIPMHTVSWQIAEQLKADIAAGRWNGTLPPERLLCAQLQVGRSTLGKALGMLRDQGLLKSKPRTGHHVAVRKVQGKHRPVFGILTPMPMTGLHPSHALYITNLLVHFQESGHECRLHHGRHYFQKGGTRALRFLFENERVDGWIVFLSTRVMQQWLAEASRPVILVGSAYPGIRLPSVDVDFRAVGRHAAGMLLKNGHRRVAFVYQRPAHAGDAECVTGFQEAIALARRDVTVQVLCHDGTVDDASRRISQLVSRPARPTGLIVINANIYAMVATTLAYHRLRVPEDVSLISRDYDFNLGYLIPPPASYRTNIEKLAKRTRALALRSLNMSCHDTHIRLISDYREGQSVGPAPDR